MRLKVVCADLESLMAVERILRSRERTLQRATMLALPIDPVRFPPILPHIGNDLELQRQPTGQLR